ncbi:hypothetical protein EON83_15215 [bacterium]|nr:MAG: hypothetical protein EON83_15215 [bacterium]
MKSLFSLGLLAVVTVAPIHAEPTAKSTVAKPLTRVLIDRDELRSIEVVTDRHESISQLFARQRIALASSPIVDNKWVDNWSQLKISKPTPVFVSYPLHNDDGFQMKFYGHNLELVPPIPAVLELFKGAPKTSDSRVYVVLAFDDGRPSPAFLDNKSRRARLIGRVQVFGAWNAESEKAYLAFSPPAH